MRVTQQGRTVMGCGTAMGHGIIPETANLSVVVRLVDTRKRMGQALGGQHYVGVCSAAVRPHEIASADSLRQHPHVWALQVPEPNFVP